MKGRERNAGFTLAEMLVVMAILALTMTLSLPYARRSSDGQQLMAESLRLASALKETRSLAMTSGEDQDIVIDLEQKTFRTPRRPAAEPIARDITLTALSARSLAGDRKAAYRFYADGSSTGGQIVMEKAGSRRTLSISWLTGAVAIESRPQ
jgi:general secretion pathway protein H